MCSITSEIGDTWIFGIASDPVKLARFRIATNLRSQCISSGQCDPNESHVWQFSRILLKGAEHTWGLDQKIAIKPYIASNWSNSDLQSLLPTPSFVSFVESWYRQRRMAIEDALELLYPHPLFFQIRDEFARQLTVPPQPHASKSWISFAPSNLPQSFSLPNGDFIAFNATNGGISALSLGGKSYASPTSPLALLQYSTYDESDYLHYAESYNYLFPVIIDKYDQMKLHIDQYGATHSIVNPTLKQVLVSTSDQSFYLELSFSEELVTYAGAPTTVWLLVDVAGPSLNLTLTVYNKTATRLPEAMFLRFVPPPLAPSYSADAWMMRKLAEWVDPADIVTGGAKRLHSVSSGISFANQIFVQPIHTPLVCFGTPTSFPTPLTKEPVWADGASFILWDNIWNTNYPQWTIDTEYVFRFKMDFR